MAANWKSPGMPSPRAVTMTTARIPLARIWVGARSISRSCVTGTYTVLWDDVEPLLRALRAAGFAAWLREYGEVYQDSPIHIHAIAIGDQELSPEAEDAADRSAGYFRGYSGLPFPEGGAPTPDRYGGPIICQWMIDLGYQDLR